ncbi:MAG: hypothetical protein ACRC5C_10485, partial [Bacilli bacterium]
TKVRGYHGALPTLLGRYTEHTGYEAGVIAETIAKHVSLPQSETYLQQKAKECTWHGFVR